MVLPTEKRLNIVDFPASSQALVDQLAITLNANFDNVYLALTNRLTFADNFQGTQKTFTVTVDANGNPMNPVSFPLNVAAGTQPRIIGCVVISATNQVSSSTYPTGAPFISYQQSGSNIQINNITGLQANQQYSLTVNVSH